MDISGRLAHDTLELIAEINRTSPTEGQAAESATHPEPVETLATLDYGGWMKRLMEQEGWRETEGKLQELFANWMGRNRRRELRRIAKDRVRKPEDGADAKLLETWVKDEDLKRLAQLVTEGEFPEPLTPVSFAIVNARTAVWSALHLATHARKLTDEEMAEVIRDLRENRDEYDYLASLGMTGDPPE